MKNLFKKSLLTLVMAGFIFNVDAMKRPAPSGDFNPNTGKKTSTELSDSDLQDLAKKLAQNIKSILTSNNQKPTNQQLEFQEYLKTLPPEKKLIITQKTQYLLKEFVVASSSIRAFRAVCCMFAQ